jgi:hypothetical protein
MVVVYVLDVAEFHEIVRSARRKPDCRIAGPTRATIGSVDGEIVFNRKHEDEACGLVRLLPAASTARSPSSGTKRCG